MTMEIQTVRMHLHCTNSATTQRTRSLKRITRRNMANKGQHSKEDKRKMAREEDAWEITT